jgi:hypothetical protein
MHLAAESVHVSKFRSQFLHILLSETSPYCFEYLQVSIQELGSLLPHLGKRQAVTQEEMNLEMHWTTEFSKLVILTVQHVR